MGSLPSRGIAPSGFRPLRKIPYCCLPQESGPFSVPVCLIVLSNQILIVALVSYYLTNKLISRKLLFRRNDIITIIHFTRKHMGYQQPFPVVIPLLKVNTHVLLTRPPLELKKLSYDLHVLGIPPAFILSQDQTLLKFPEFFVYI